MNAAIEKKEYHDGLKAHKKVFAQPKTSGQVFQFKVPCDPRLHATVVGGSRTMAQVLMAVAHGTQGKTGPGGALQTATYFASGSASGSAHFCVDGDECYRCGKDSEILAGVLGVNTWTEHWEMSSLSVWTRATWFLPFNKRMLNRTAYKMARFMLHYGIPNKFWTTKMLDDRGAVFLRSGTKMGWTYHRCLSNSKLSDSTHQDPWPPKSTVSWYFRRRVTYYYEHPEDTTYEDAA